MSAIIPTYIFTAAIGMIPGIILGIPRGIVIRARVFMSLSDLVMIHGGGAARRGIGDMTRGAAPAFMADIGDHITAGGVRRIITILSIATIHLMLLVIAWWRVKSGR
jgi:hypothetical protein